MLWGTEPGVGCSRPEGSDCRGKEGIWGGLADRVMELAKQFSEDQAFQAGAPGQCVQGTVRGLV